jgi:hypothetical protein
VNKILDIPLEVKSLNEVTQAVMRTSGKHMCERLDGKAEAARKIYLRTGEIQDLYVWAGYARQADSARITYNQWKRGEL